MLSETAFAVMTPAMYVQTPTLGAFVWTTIQLERGPAAVGCEQWDSNIHEYASCPYLSTAAWTGSVPVVLVAPHKDPTKESRLLVCCTYVP